MMRSSTSHASVGALLGTGCCHDFPLGISLVGQTGRGQSLIDLIRLCDLTAHIVGSYTTCSARGIQAEPLFADVNFIPGVLAERIVVDMHNAEHDPHGNVMGLAH